MSKKLFLRKWRIVSMEKWGDDYINLIEPGYIEFSKKSNSGSLHFGVVYAGINYKTSKDSQNKTVIEFSFSGDDEGDEVCGRGDARIIDNTLEGEIYFHQGDESSFIAKPFK